MRNMLTAQYRQRIAGIENLFKLTLEPFKQATVQKMKCFVPARQVQLVATVMAPRSQRSADVVFTSAKLVVSGPTHRKTYARMFPELLSFEADERFLHALGRRSIDITPSAHARVVQEIG